MVAQGPNLRSLGGAESSRASGWWTRSQPSPGQRHPESLSQPCGACGALAGKSHSVRKDGAQPWRRPTHPAPRCPAGPGGKPLTALSFQCSLEPLPPHHGPHTHQSCSFRTPRARGPACVGLRWPRVCATISHRPPSELSAGDLQRRAPERESYSCPAATAYTVPGDCHAHGWACPAEMEGPPQGPAFRPSAAPST